MSGDMELRIYLHEYKLEALASVLEAEGTTIEDRIHEILTGLYVSLVPKETRQAIRSRIDTEHAMWEAEREAACRYTLFRVNENGRELFFRANHSVSFLEVAKFLRRYLRQETDTLDRSFTGLIPITAAQYDQLPASRIDDPQKITGVFDLDFDKREVSTMDDGGSWLTYSMDTVSSAVYHAYRKNYLLAEQYRERFLERLEGKEISHTEEATPFLGPAM